MSPAGTGARVAATKIQGRTDFEIKSDGSSNFANYPTQHHSEWTPKGQWLKVARVEKVRVGPSWRIRGFDSDGKPVFSGMPNTKIDTR